MVTQSVDGVAFLTSPLLETPHGFSTRLGGVSSGIFESLNLGLHRGDDPLAVEENYRRFCRAVGADPGRLALGNQVHGANVLEVTEKQVKKGLFDPVSYEADGLMTDLAGVGLVVFTADCVPILLHDPVTGCVAALHAGWRGTAGGIGAEGVRRLSQRYGARPEDIRAAIGPAIGPCCFQTDGDVPEAMERALGTRASAYIRAEKGKFWVDLKGINGEILRNAGVLPEHLEICGECTHCHPEKYWSHRYTKGERGSQAAIICLRKEGGG